MAQQQAFKLDPNKFDTRLLAWGGYLSISDQKSNKENRWILTINFQSSEIIVVQHEQKNAVYPFGAVLCVFANLKYENALMIFWKNAKPPLQFFFDSSNDRDNVQQILESIPKNNIQHNIMSVGCVPSFGTQCEKKGKMKWAPRYIILVKSRLLIFRDNNKLKSLYPLQMISLLEPNIQVIKSQQYGNTVDIYVQEKHFYFKLKSINQVKEFIDNMSKTRERMNHEAIAVAKLKLMQQSQSKRDMMQKSMVARQDYVSRREISQRKFNINADNAKSVQKVMLANGSTMSFKGLDAESMSDLGSGGINIKRKGKRIKFDKAFKPNKHKSDIFMWGKARPARLFPKHSASQQPFKHDALSQKRFVFVTTSKDGTHCMGFTDNDWTFVWGECNFTGALGLGAKVKSTLPYLIKTLRKQNIIQVSCSGRHGLAITVTSKVFGWGAKTLTNLGFDTQEPQPLPFLDNLGILAINCSNTHSVAYSTLNKDVYSFGMKGPWLGLVDSTGNKTFGKIPFNNIINDPSSKIFISKICVSTQYTMYLLSNGTVYTTGVNEHGRMGCTKDISQTQKPIRINIQDSIGEISTAQFHSGFVSFKGRLYTTGVGADYRLGHENENTYYQPKYVENLSQVKCARVECVQDRTFVTTKYGAVLMYGVEPVTRQTYRKPFIFEFLRTHRIYQVCGAKDFTVALGVQHKDQVQRPNVDEEQNDLKLGQNYQDYSRIGANTINQNNVIGNGQKINTVINPGYMQSSNNNNGGLPQMNSSGTGPPPFVPLDAMPMNSFGAKPLPDVVPVKGFPPAAPSKDFQGQLPNPFANPGYGNLPPPIPNIQHNFGNGPPGPPGPPQFGGMPPPQNQFGGPPQQNHFGGPPQQNPFGGPPQQNPFGSGPPPTQNQFASGPPSNKFGSGPPPPPRGFR